MTANRQQERLFVRHGFRHYRRTYSLREVRLGVLLALAMIGISVWVAWRGAHPDPMLKATAADFQEASAAERDSVLPTDLGDAEWKQTATTSFDSENLYVKINGRADFFLAFGFKTLYSSSLAHADGAAIDLELYDMGSPANALGTFAGEKPEHADVESFTYTTRNAFFMARGNYYLRAIGSDDSKLVTSKLESLKIALSSTLEDGPRPWAYALFESVGMNAKDVSYYPTNAFSFGFAANVWAARKADDSQLFVVAMATEAEADDMARSFVEGFKEYGETTKGGWIKDRFLGAVSMAVASDRWVVGVRAAATVDSGSADLESLNNALRKLPEDVKAAAIAAPTPPSPPSPDDADDWDEQPTEVGGTGDQTNGIDEK